MVVANVLLNTSDRNKSVIRTDLDESKMWTSAIEATMGVPVMDLIQNKSLERTGKRLDGVGSVGIRLTPKRLGIQLVQFRLFGNGILLDEARYLPKTRFAETIIAYGRLLPMEEAMTIEKESLSTHRNSR